MNTPVALLLILFASGVNHADADPCRVNFGGCDAQNGLCWGTGVDTNFCTCKAGYKEFQGLAIHYCIDVNECTDEHICPENSVCNNLQGSYECKCSCGYVKDYTGEQCLRSDQIMTCEHPTLCDFNGTPSRYDSPTVAFSIRYKKNYLTNEASRSTGRSTEFYRRSCKCEDGYEFDNCGYCVDIDECFRDRPCTGFASSCVNTEGSYYCECAEGYVLGVCRKNCYRQGEEIPLVCEENDLSQLRMQDISTRTFVRPIPLTIRQTCDRSEVGTTSVMTFDIDHNRETDLRLTWLCTGRGKNLVTAAEEKARWGEWSCWTACKATCWGGLQTRVRKCLHGLPGLEGCYGGGSQKRECYKGTKCAFRYRKDADSLTKTERDDLVQAMRKYKEDKTVRGFFNAGAAHGWPYQCGGRSCCLHGAKLKFLAWHRTIILNYEKGISRFLKDKTLGVPYWNWLKNPKAAPSLAWDKVIDGETNPFSGMTVRIDLPADAPNRNIARDNAPDSGMLTQATNIWEETIEKLNKPYILHEFSESLEGAHGLPHVSICTNFFTCSVSMASLSFAGFDPIFMFHHAQIDRLWAVAQKNLEDDGNATWTLQTTLESSDEDGDFGRRHAPFDNKTINAFPIVQTVNTMLDSYYYEELTGVKYDDLENNGFPPIEAVTSRFLREPGAEALFVAQYLQSVDENVYINYYNTRGRDTPCNQLRSPVARTLLQGTKNSFRLSIPRLTPTDRLYPLDTQHAIKACYTRDLDCRDRCTEEKNETLNTMPDPLLVHYLPNLPIDVYKFQWGSQTKLPTWYINLDAGSQWVLFFGDRASNVMHVRSSWAWLKCSHNRGRNFGCDASTTEACVLRAGIYYLIDKDEDLCRNGMRMIIVARK